MTTYNFSSETKRIREALRTLRTCKSLAELPSVENLASMLVKKVYLKGETVDALILTLTPSGCQWAKKSGGCTMCGEFSGSMGGQVISPDYHIAQFAIAVTKYFPNIATPWLRIYNEGSFLNPDELSPVACDAILGLSSVLSGIRRVTIESLPEFVTDDTLDRLKNIIGNRIELEIGIGLESQDDIIRNVCLNKGESKSQYQKAIETIKAHKMRSLAYVLIKPPFLSEGEAFHEAIRTVEFAFDIGFDSVKLEPVSIHGWSFLEALASQGLYDVPWLWTVVEVVKGSRHLGEIRIGGLEYYPRPSTVAHNHHLDSKCSDELWKAIKQYNQTQDPSMFEGVHCDCQKSWRDIVNQKEGKRLEDRIKETLDDFSLETYLQKKR